MYLPICYFLHFYGQKKKMSVCEKLAKFMMLTVTLAVIKMLFFETPKCAEQGQQPSFTHR